MTDTGAALLRAILAHPDDDTARLVYADWLEENGKESRAKFIRAQMWLWANPSCGSCSGSEWAAGKPCAECRTREAQREHTALDLFGRGRWREYAGPAGAVIPTGRRWDDCLKFTRGFVSEVHLTLAAYCMNAESIFRAHPVTKIQLTTHDPLSSAMYGQHLTAMWRDYSDEQNMSGYFNYYLPAVLFDRLTRGELCANGRPPICSFFRRYSVASTESRDDLSDACVAHGRALAGLPPLGVSA